MAQSEAISHIIVFQGDVKQREEERQVPPSTSDSAHIAPDLPIGRVRPARGTLLGILLGVALWAAILGVIFLFVR